MATLSSEKNYINEQGPEPRQYYATGFIDQDGTASTIRATPGAGYQFVVVGGTVYKAPATAQTLTVADGTSNVDTLFSTSAVADTPKHIPPGGVRIPIGADKPLTIDASAGNFSGTVFYVLEAV